MGAPSAVGPHLRTKRLLLRPPTPHDLPALCVMNADPAVMRYFPAPMQPGEVEAMCQRIEDHFRRCGFGFWAVERTADAALIGLIGLAEVHFALRGRPWPPPDGARPAVEIGWRLIPSAWGQGYAGEAAAEALRFGFEALDLDELFSFTVPMNTRSCGLMERLGLRRDPEGDFDHPRLPVGHPLRPHVLYRLGRADWTARAGATRT